MEVHANECRLVLVVGPERLLDELGRGAPMTQ
jgi:hypothetical protein